MDQQSVDNSLAILKAAIKRILELQPLVENFEDLYKNGFTLVLYRHGKLLYDTVQELFTQHVKTRICHQILDRALENSSAPTIDTLGSLIDSWDNYRISVNMIRDILAYMDRVYVPKHGLNGVKILGLHVFRDEVLAYHSIRRTVLGEIMKNRNGQHGDCSRVLKFCEILKQLGDSGMRTVYRENFEEPFLQQSADYFNSFVETLMGESNNNAFTYLTKVRGTIDKEIEIVNLFMDPSTLPLLKILLEEIFIKRQIGRMLAMENSTPAQILKQFYDLDGSDRDRGDNSVDLTRIFTQMDVGKSREKILTAIQNEQDFLSILTGEWYEHIIFQEFVGDLLLSVGRANDQKNLIEKLTHIKTTMFPERIIEDPAINSHLVRTLLTLVENVRHDKIVYRGSFKKCCEMLIELGTPEARIYDRLFENRFLDQSSTFYMIQSASIMADAEEPCSFYYTQKILTLMTSEVELVTTCLNKSTEPKLVKLMADQLVQPYMDTIVGADQESATLNFTNLFKFFLELDEGPTSLSNSMMSYFNQRSIVLFNLPSAVGTIDPMTFVHNLWKCQVEFYHFLTDSFENHKKFQQMLMSCLQQSVNRTDRAPELLSLFIHKQILLMAGKDPEPDMETELDKGVTLFHFLQDKDLFEQFYRRHLMRRILHSVSRFDGDLELSVISKLRTICGGHFTIKLEGMLNDMAVSSTTMDEFNQVLPEEPEGSSINSLPSLDLSVRILNSRFWPFSSKMDSSCILPNAANTAFENFKRFYMSKHTGRRLKLLSNLGTADLVTTFQYSFMEPIGGSSSTRPRQYHIQVSTHQMCVLLLFSDIHSKWSFQDILEQSDIPVQDLKISLQSMAMGKTNQRILSRIKGTTEEIEASDIFTVNESFTSRSHRIKIQIGSRVKLDPETERKETLGHVEAGRKFEIEAAIVRIMKARQRLSHSNLVTEVQEQLQRKFLPSSTLIKLRIEDLIERDYLTRTEEDRNVYIYTS